MVVESRSSWFWLRGNGNLSFASIFDDIRGWFSLLYFFIGILNDKICKSSHIELNLGNNTKVINDPIFDIIGFGKIHD